MKKSMEKLESQFEAFLKIAQCEDSEEARVFAEYTVEQSETVLITGADVHDGEITVHGYHCLTKGWITFILTEPDNVFIIPNQLNVTVHDVLQLTVFDDYCQAVRIMCLEALFSDNSLELPDDVVCKVIKSYKVNQPFKSLSIMHKDAKIGISIPLGTMALYVIENKVALNADLVKEVIDYSMKQLGHTDVPSRYTAVDLTDVSKVYGYLVNAELNEHMKEFAVYREVADLLLVYRYMLQESSQGDISAIISKAVADSHGWSEEFLYEQWLKNTNDASSYKIDSMPDILQEFPGEHEIPDDVGNYLNMYVLTNKTRLNASGAVLRPEIMADLQKIFGRDFYLIPSSVNEFLAISTEIEVDDVKQMVSSVNAQCLSHDEFLSNSVYQYDFDTNELKAL